MLNLQTHKPRVVNHLELTFPNSKELRIGTFVQLGVVVDKILIEKVGLLEGFKNRTTPHKVKSFSHNT